PNASKLVITDVTKNMRIAAIPYDTFYAAMNDKVFVTLTQSNTIQGYDLASGTLIWSVNENRSDRISAFDDISFLTDGGRERLVVRSYADGSILRSFPRSLGEITNVSTSGRGITMFSENNLRVIANPGPDGHRYWMFPSSYYSLNPGLISDGLVVLDDPAELGVKFKLLDCATGASLTTISARYISKYGSEGGRFGLTSETGKLTIFGNRSVVPGPLQTEVTRKEDEDPSTWKITLAEAAAFPVTVRLLSGNDDIQATAPVTIPAGGLSAAFPARIMKDGIPEYDETFPLEIVVSGNGQEGTYQINVTIPRNEYEVFPQLKDGDLLVGGSSVGAHPTGLVIGTTRGSAAVDPIYKKIYRSPKGLIGFGFAVACNELFMATSAVDLPVLRGILKPSRSRVFLYNRKSGKQVVAFSEKTTGTALGAVLHMDSERLYAGAPGKDVLGSVLRYDIKTKKSTTLTEPGAKDPRSRFGASITSSGNQIWIGAPLASTGKVYQFDGATGKLVRVLTPPDGGRANFGTALEIVNGKLMVGAPQLKNGAAVFSFELNTGNYAGTINSPFQDGGNFGASLAVPRKDILAVGCPNSLFAPEGGVLLYQFPSGKAQLVTMLRSSNETDLSPQNGLGYFGGMGAVGGLAGTDPILMAAVDIRRSPIDILDVPAPNYAYPQVGLISLEQYLPQVSKSISSLARSVAVVSKNPWERALGQGSTEGNCRLELRKGVSGWSVLLPDIASIAAGTALYLEKSSDLRHWTSVASCSGDSGVGWRLSSGEQLPAGNLALPVPIDERSAYYRIRCEAP
ncbi:MAG: hypothetical protein ABI600_12095, partial [Luteolibacter sp.]